MDNSMSESRKRLFRRGDRVRLTAKGERVLRQKPYGVALHKSGEELSQTGTVMRNSRGYVVFVQFDSAPTSPGYYYACSLWALTDEPPRKPAKLGAAKAATSTNDTITLDLIRMLSEENARLRVAGAKLAVAAIRVATEYDGCHRLMLAVSGWTKAMADEHGRGEQNTNNHEEKR